LSVGVGSIFVVVVAVVVVCQNMMEAGASLFALIHTHTVTECSGNAERLSNGNIYI